LLTNEPECLGPGKTENNETLFIYILQKLLQ